MDRCDRCGATDVVWARTDRGRPMLVDRGSHPKGNVVLIPETHGQGGLRAHVLVKAELETETRPRTFAHAAYCGKVKPSTDVPKPEAVQVEMFQSELVTRDGQLTVEYQPKESP
jgi:hypothetical protein